MTSISLSTKELADNKQDRIQDKKPTGKDRNLVVTGIRWHALAEYAKTKRDKTDSIKYVVIKVPRVDRNENILKKNIKVYCKINQQSLKGKGKGLYSYH